MKVHRLSFFATRSDLRELVAQAEQKYTLFAFQAGGYLLNKEFRATAIAEIPNLYEFCPPDAALAPCYFVWRKKVDVNFREIKMRNGEKKIIVTPMSNPEAVVFRPGGTHDARTVISGELVSASENAEAQELFLVFKKLITSNLKRVRSYYVGKEAMEVFLTGGRLTSSLSSPREYDLAIE